MAYFSKLLGVYNERFFPLPELAQRANVFADPEDMIARVGTVMCELMVDEARYTEINGDWVATIDELYSIEDYRRHIRATILGQFELFPKA